MRAYDGMLTPSRQTEHPCSNQSILHSIHKAFKAFCATHQPQGRFGKTHKRRSGPSFTVHDHLRRCNTLARTSPQNLNCREENPPQFLFALLPSRRLLYYTSLCPPRSPTDATCFSKRRERGRNLVHSQPQGNVHFLPITVCSTFHTLNSCPTLAHPWKTCVCFTRSIPTVMVY